MTKRKDKSPRQARPAPQQGTGKTRRHALMEKGMEWVFLAAACASILAVLLICVFLFANGVPAMAEIGLGKFLGGTQWKPTAEPARFGILPMILGSIYVTAGAVLVGVPVGLLAALFMARWCPKKLHRVLKPVVDLLAGIPSIVYGFFGMVVLVPFVRDTFGGNGNSMLTASLLLGIMILPTIIGMGEAALRAVPEQYYEGALALGATKERAVFFTVLPAAKSGVLAAVILGIGRAIGETMAVIMVAGNQARMPKGILQGIRTMTANIVQEMGYAADLHREALIATGVVLFVFILLINGCFAVLKERSKRQTGEPRRKRLFLRKEKPADGACLQGKETAAASQKKRRNGSAWGRLTAAVENSRPGKALGRLTAAVRRKHPGSLLGKFAVCLGILITVAVLVFLMGYVLIKGIPNLTSSLFAWKYTTENVSVIPSIITTVYITLLSLLIAVPLGIGCAIYLVEYAKKDNRLVRWIRLTTETLSGIPSIVYGLFGTLFFVTVLGWSYSLLAGACTLAIMILPLVIRSTEEALIAVPDLYREASFGLGAGRLRTVFRVVLPAAVPGILSGVILAIGRIVGETAALIYTAGTAAKIPDGLLSSGRTLAIHMYMLSGEGLNTDKAYATAVVLLVTVLLINMAASAIAKRIAKQ